MRIPVTTSGIRLITAVALVVAAAGCGDDDDSSDVVTIPSSDGSSPSVVMDAHFNVEQRPFLTVGNGSVDVVLRRSRAQVVVDVIERKGDVRVITTA